ncbi:hypothetical protein [Nonomuraea longicatena]|uniref:Uncharacterized protein n=1 Tax=Nonomuraea longicatena TaxID=83682 RepID=A0ABN1Q4M6_9ACTN
MSKESVPQPPSRDRQDPAFWKREFDRYVGAAMTATLAGRHVEALDAAHEARLAADRLQSTIVRNARAAGTSWSAIGRAAMLTKQAAWTRWKHVETTAITPAQLERHLVVVITTGRRGVDDDSPEYGLDLAPYLHYDGWAELVTDDPRVDALIEEGLERYWVRVAPLDWIASRIPGLAEAVAADPGSPLMQPAMTQFVLVLDSDHQMEELHDLLRIADIREVLEVAEKTRLHALGFSVDSSADGDFYISLVGVMAGADIGAELRALTQVLTAAGYEVIGDPDDSACGVIARLAPPADPAAVGCM